MVNKKGQEMSVATLVLIVIGIVVLVMLILGFSMGWQNLWGKINILGGSSNVETVIQACNIAATSDSAVNYCDEFKQVTIADTKQFVNCQYSDVEAGLNKKLACNGRAAGQTAKDYCAKLYGATLTNGIISGISAANAANLEKDANLYNGKICLEYLTGKTIPADAQAYINNNKIIFVTQADKDACKKLVDAATTAADKAAATLNGAKCSVIADSPPAP